MIHIKNGKVVLKDGVADGRSVWIDGDKIVPGANGAAADGAETIDAGGLYVSPGFIDLHVHGGGGADFIDGSPESVITAVRLHTLNGTTAICPTSVACGYGDLFKFLDNVSEASRYNEYAEIIGPHLEGPYLSAAEKGAQPEECIFPLVRDEYMKILDYKVKPVRITFAPELPGAEEFIAEMNKRGIRGSIGHTNAEYPDVLAAYESGVRLLTHFYSGMNGVHRVNAYRKLGVIECGYLLDGMSVEAIADARHLPVELLQLICKIKGTDSVILVTDAMRAAGTDAETSVLGGKPVFIRDGVAFMPDGSAFAGSVATTSRLVRTMYRLAGFPLHEAVKMASLNPARYIGVSDRKGSLDAGKDADIVMFDDNIDIKRVIVRGKTVYSCCEERLSN